MTTSLAEYFPTDEVESAKKLITEFHGKLLVNKEPGANNLALLIVYMLSNKNKANAVSDKESAVFFETCGCGSSVDYSKAIYELSKRAKTPLVLKKDDTISMTFAGLSKVKSILAGTRDKQ